MTLQKYSQNTELSIIIPTKNRYETLLHILPSLLENFIQENIEIIVQDNSDDNEKMNLFMNNSKYLNLKYYYTKRRISVTENCDLAISNSKGEYIIIIGDDDYVLPNIIGCTKWMKNNNIDCLNSETATYNWGDMQFKFKTYNSTPNTFFLAKKINNKYKVLNAKRELAKIIKIGGTHIGQLPRIYHGIVKRNILEKIFEQCSTYFPGPSPDMASSVALSLFCNSFAIYESPFSISGKSFLSTSGQGVRHEHSGNLELLPHLDQELIGRWDKKIPRFWSCSTIWSQSLSDSLKSCGSQIKINYKYLYSFMLVYEYRNLINYYSIIRKHIEFEISDIVISVFYLPSIIAKRIISLIKRRYFPNTSLIIKDIESITRVKDYLKI